MTAQEANDVRPRICLGGILLGLLVTIAGLTWPLWARPSLVWTAEQAAEYQSAGEALHAARRIDPTATGGNSDPDDGGEAGQSDSQLAVAQERFDKIRAELAAAQSLRQRAGAWLRWLGLAMMLLFGLGYLASSRD
jgi:hypothetical protein